MISQCNSCGKQFVIKPYSNNLDTCATCYIKNRHSRNKITRLNMAMVKELNRKAGQHFFSKDTMRFFKSKVPEDHVGLTANRYFISSEKSPWDKRKYSIREWKGKTKTIDTVGEFGAYSSKAQAERILKKIIEGKGGLK